MAGAYVQIEGVERVSAYLKEIREGAETAGHETILVGSPLRYAFGIETGRHRGGRLARRAGGAYYLRDAFRAVQPRIRPALVAALPKGAQAVLQAMRKLGYDVEREAKERVPVRTGTLRRSLHTVVAR